MEGLIVLLIVICYWGGLVLYFNLSGGQSPKELCPPHAWQTRKGLLICDKCSWKPGDPIDGQE